MNPEKRLHVLGLSPREQFLLKLVMSNLMAGFIDKSICDAPWVTADEVAMKATNAVKFFQRYTEFCEMLCTESTLAKAKPKVLMLGSTLMKYLVIAVNAYDPQESLLSEEHQRQLAGPFPDLKKKIVDSSKHTYTSWEIEQARHAK